MNPMNWMLPVQYGLVAGLVLSLALTAVVSVGQVFSRDFMVHDYPPAIRARYGPKSTRGRRTVAVVGVLLYAVIVGVLSVLMVWLRSSLGDGFGFVTAWISSITALFVFNLYDLIVLDWLVFVLWRPRLIVLPGTEGMSEYGDFGFHLRGFLTGLVFCLVGSVLTAGITVGLEVIT
jgi:hypothetical protein